MVNSTALVYIKNVKKYYIRNYFNFTRYWQLIKRQRSLDQIGELLNNIDKREGSQLASYSRILNSQVHYNQLKKYKYLLKEYLTQSIEINEFILKFFKLFWEDCEIFETFEDDLELVFLFSLNSNLNQLDKYRFETLEDFGKLIEEIYEACTLYEFEIEQEKEELQIFSLFASHPKTGFLKL